MRGLTPIAVTLALSLLAGACDQRADKDPSFEVRVAPLTLPGITDACYTLTDYNSSSEFDAATTVWTQSHVCATQFGDSVGDVSYVGPCDASVAPDDTTFELVLEGLWTGGAHDASGATQLADGSDFVNPCTSADAAHTCRLSRLCEENADVSVVFNITVMRSATQGFFDVAVNFEDIFCSAKVDCQDDQGHELDLLFNGDHRDQTAVMAFACTAGDKADTHMYLSDTYIVCDHDTTNNTAEPPDPNKIAIVAQLSPSAGPGNVASPSPGLFGWAVYHGREQLGDYHKQYSDMAIGVKDSLFQTDFFGTPTTRACWLVAFGSASDGAWNAAQTPLDSTYPVIHYGVPLNPPAAGQQAPSATLSCGQNPLDGAGSHVTTAYDTVSDETCFENVIDGHWGDPSGDVATTHYSQYVHNHGPWHPEALDFTSDLIASWSDPEDPRRSLSSCIADYWERENRLYGAQYAPVNLAGGPQTITVTACQDAAPYNGVCDPGEVRLPGVSFAVRPSLYPGTVFDDIATAATNGSGQATFTLGPGDYGVRYVAHLPDDSATLLCSGTDGWYEAPPAGWPRFFAVDGPVVNDHFDFAVHCR